MGIVKNFHLCFKDSVLRPLSFNSNKDTKKEKSQNYKAHIVPYSKFLFKS